jgi:hypothetical protein
MMFHLCMFKDFLCVRFSTLTEDDVLNMTKAEFKHYCGMADYFADVASSVMVQTNTRIETEANKIGVIITMNLLTGQEA